MTTGLGLCTPCCRSMQVRRDQGFLGRYGPESWGCWIDEVDVRGGCILDLRIKKFTSNLDEERHARRAVRNIASEANAIHGAHLVVTDSLPGFLGALAPLAPTAWHKGSGPWVSRLRSRGMESRPSGLTPLGARSSSYTKTVPEVRIHPPMYDISILLPLLFESVLTSE